MFRCQTRTTAKRMTLTKKQMNKRTMVATRLKRVAEPELACRSFVRRNPSPCGKEPGVVPAPKAEVLMVSRLYRLETQPSRSMSGMWH